MRGSPTEKLIGVEAGSADALGRLEAVPAESRDAQYWSARAEVALFHNDFDEAVRCWARARGSGSVSRRVVVDLVTAALEAMEGGRSGWSTRRLGPRLLGLGLEPEGERMLGASLVREMEDDLSGGPGRVASLLTEATTFALQSRHERLASFRAELHVRMGNELAARTIWRLTCGGTRKRIRLQLAASYLREGDLQRADEMLDGADVSHPDGKRIAAALEIARGNWLLAAALLRDIPSVPVAVSLLGEIGEALGECEAAERSPAAASYRANAYLDANDIDSFAQLLDRVPREDGGWIGPVRARGDGLRAAECLDEGDATGAAVHLARCVLGVDRHRAALIGAELPAAIVSDWLRTERRSALRRCLEAGVTHRGRFTAEACHRYGLCLLGDGVVAQREGRSEDANSDWTMAGAFLAVAIGDTPYMSSWVRRRQASYATSLAPPSGADAAESVAGEIEHMLSRLVADHGIPEGGSDPAARFRWEVLGVRALRAIGPLVSVDGSPVLAGPYLTAVLGLGSEVEDGLRSAASRCAPKNLEQVAAIFSPLCGAWDLALQGEFYTAARMLDETLVNSDRSPALSWRFSEGLDALDRARISVCVSVFMDAADQLAGSTAFDPADCERWWGIAVDLARGLGRAEETANRALKVAMLHASRLSKTGEHRLGRTLVSGANSASRFSRTGKLIQGEHPPVADGVL